MSLRMRLTLLWGIVAVSTTGSAVSSVWAFWRLREPLDFAVECLEQQRRAQELEIRFLRSAAELEHWLSQPDSDRSEYDAGRLRLGALLQEIGSVAQTDAERQTVESLGVDLDTIDTVVQRVEFLRQKGAEPVEPRTHAWLRDTLWPEYRAEVAKLVATPRDRLNAATEAARRASRLAVLVILIGVGVLIAMVGAGMVLVRRWLVQPVEVLGGAARAIGQGTFQGRIELDRADELGSLARDLESMASSLQRYQTELVEHERLAAVGEMTASVAHNLRNPLASIRALAQASSLVEPENSPHAGTFRTIMQTVDRTDRWLRELLGALRPVSLDRSAHDPGQLLDLVVGAASVSAERAGLSLRRIPSANLPAVLVDASKFEQALLSLVFNAVEAGVAGTEVELRVESTGDRVRYSVADRGPGLTPEVEQRMFKPFFSTKRSGTGLGLYLARRVVVEHGGVLDARSRPGGGCEMILSLPIAPADPPAALEIAAQGAP